VEALIYVLLDIASETEWIMVTCTLAAEVSPWMPF